MYKHILCLFAFISLCLCKNIDLTGQPYVSFNNDTNKYEVRLNSTLSRCINCVCPEEDVYSRCGAYATVSMAWVVRNPPSGGHIAWILWDNKRNLKFKHSDAMILPFYQYKEACSDDRQVCWNLENNNDMIISYRGKQVNIGGPCQEASITCGGGKAAGTGMMWNYDMGRF